MQKSRRVKEMVPWDADALILAQICLPENSLFEVRRRTSVRAVQGVYFQ